MTTRIWNDKRMRTPTYKWMISSAFPGCGSLGAFYSKPSTYVIDCLMVVPIGTTIQYESNLKRTSWGLLHRMTSQIDPHFWLPWRYPRKPPDQDRPKPAACSIHMIMFECLNGLGGQGQSTTPHPVIHCWACPFTIFYFPKLPRGLSTAAAMPHGLGGASHLQRPTHNHIAELPAERPVRNCQQWAMSSREKNAPVKNWVAHAMLLSWPTVIWYVSIAVQQTSLLTRTVL